VTFQTSPGGSLFPYPYKGGELFGLHFGSFHADEEGLLARMKAEEAFMANTHRQFPLWIDFYETKLTDRVLIEFLNSMYRSRAHITKLGIVGCSRRDKNRISRLQKKLNLQLPVVIRFFDDPEVAKTWLISET
jgi:hypothetical protein